MIFINKKGQIFVPDGADIEVALKRTTTLCIAAHQDDTEIMAYHDIEKCHGSKTDWFTSVIVTDGAGSPRTGIYSEFTDDDMKKVRSKEQNTAAMIGGYSAQIQLSYSSKDIYDDSKTIENEIASIVKKCKPSVVCTHNLADKHKTHVNVAIRTIAALKSLDKEELPKKLYGLEVWRNLDWLSDDKKAVFDCSNRQNLASALMGVFDSQIAGGKMYDQAALGRRKANATFLGDHSVDEIEYAVYGIDMTQLMRSEMTCAKFIQEHIEQFKNNVLGMVTSLSK